MRQRVQVASLLIPGLVQLSCLGLSKRAPPHGLPCLPLWSPTLNPNIPGWGSVLAFIFPMSASCLLVKAGLHCRSDSAWACILCLSFPLLVGTGSCWATASWRAQLFSPGQALICLTSGERFPPASWPWHCQSPSLLHQTLTIPYTFGDLIMGPSTERIKPQKSLFPAPCQDVLFLGDPKWQVFIVWKTENFKVHTKD